MERTLTKQELNDIALGIVRNTHFISWNVPKDMIPMIFMPLVFMDESQRAEMESFKPVAFYAENKNAASLGINGYPCFWSMGYLNEQENKYVVDKCHEFLNAEEEIWSQDSQENTNSLATSIPLWSRLKGWSIQQLNTLIKRLKPLISN